MRRRIKNESQNFFLCKCYKTGSDGVLRKATEIAARSGYQCKVYEDASCMFADCIEEDEDEPACIVTIGGDGTTLRAVSHAVNQGIEIITPILGINLGKIGFSVKPASRALKRP